MIPAGFDYARVDTAGEAVALLGQFGEDAKLLAGGHSLLPLMKLRFAQPSVLIDIGRVRDMSGIVETDGVVVIGALARHHDVETSQVVRRHLPLLAAAASRVGDPQVRHRGTIGGSVAHGDPASDLPAALLALGAEVVVLGPRGRRVVPTSELFTGFLETSIEPDEILVEIRVPSHEGAPWSFHKFSRRAIDWAIVGVAAVGGPRLGLALVNMAPTPVEAPSVVAAMTAGRDAHAAADEVERDVAPQADLNATVEYRLHLARTLVRRALDEVGRADRGALA